MTLKQRCQAGEAKLDQVSAALLKPGPEVLERCEADLEEIIALLESDAATLPVDPPSDKADLLRLRNRIRLLALQTQQATNLCQGWAQLRLAEGYTDQGQPALPTSEPQASYEV